MYSYHQEEGEAPPFSSLFGENSDDGDESDGGGDAACAAAAAAAAALHSAEPPPMATPQTIDETDLHAVTKRIGEALPCVCCRRQHRGGSDGHATNLLAPEPTGDDQDLEPARSAALVELHYRIELIGRHMGSLALCRGSRGDALHEAGAVDATLGVLAALNRNEMLRAGAGAGASTKDDNPKHEVSYEVDAPTPNENEMVQLPPIRSSSCIDALDQAAIALASACMGSIRDLACGNASNRAAISDYSTALAFPSCSTPSDDATTVITGPQILASYVKRYHLLHWEDILQLEGGIGRDRRGRKELRLLTDATGAIRNSSHSTPKTCAGLHSALLTEMFIWRLKEGSKETDAENVPTTLPDSSRPWREASFRIAGSLINISERCFACAQFCGADLDLIRLLVEAWGGAAAKKKQTPASTPMLHLGLAAILHSADAISPLDESLASILAKEDARKQFARKKEAERQKRIAQGLK